MGATDELPRSLYAAMLADSVDEIDIIRHTIRPLDSWAKIIERFGTESYAASYSLRDDENSYEIEIRPFNDLKSGGITVLAGGNRADRIALCGDLLSTSSHISGAVGLVIDVLVRDTYNIAALGFAMFHCDFVPLRQRSARQPGPQSNDRSGCAGRSGWHSQELERYCVRQRRRGRGGAAIHRDNNVDQAIKRMTSKSSISAEFRNGPLLAKACTKYGVL